MGIRSDRAIWEAESEGLELIDLTIGNLLDQQAASRPDYDDAEADDQPGIRKYGASDDADVRHAV
jgi:hypothetical protein